MSLQNRHSIPWIITVRAMHQPNASAGGLPGKSLHCIQTSLRGARTPLRKRLRQTQRRRRSAIAEVTLPLEAAIKMLVVPKALGPDLSEPRARCSGPGAGHSFRIARDSRRIEVRPKVGLRLPHPPINCREADRTDFGLATTPLILEQRRNHPSGQTSGHRASELPVGTRLLKHHLRLALGCLAPALHRSVPEVVRNVHHQLEACLKISLIPHFTPPEFFGARLCPTKQRAKVAEGPPYPLKVEVECQEQIGNVHPLRLALSSSSAGPARAQRCSSGSSRG